MELQRASAAVVGNKACKCGAWAARAVARLAPPLLPPGDAPATPLACQDLGDEQEPYMRRDEEVGTTATYGHETSIVIMHSSLLI